MVLREPSKIQLTENILETMIFIFWNNKQNVIRGICELLFPRGSAAHTVWGARAEYSEKEATVAPDVCAFAAQKVLSRVHLELFLCQTGRCFQLHFAEEKAEAQRVARLSRGHCAVLWALVQHSHEVLKPFRN